MTQLAPARARKRGPVTLGVVTEEAPICPFSRAQWCVVDEDNLDVWVWKGGEKFHCTGGSLKSNQALWYEEQGLLTIEYPTPLSEALDASLDANPDLFGDAPEPELVADPEVDPRDAELAAARAREAELMAELARLKAAAPVVVESAGVPLIPDDLADAVAIQDVATPEERRHLTERLNIEKGELRRERLGGDTPSEREAQVDRLLNWLAQFGEA